MKKKALRQDFFMEIRKSLGRFISILFIVALGVAFFSGIRSSQPDMLLTGDSYVDQLNLMDIKVISTLGLTEDDLEAIQQLEGVAHAEGGYSVDGIFKEENNQNVIHVMSELPTMNETEVTEGRLPKEKNECLVDDESGYKIGDVIKLESGDDTDLEDTLAVTEFEVVGTGSSPCYISFSRGSSQIGKGSVKAFMVVPDESFSMDVYTEVYVEVEGAKKLPAFSKKYDEKIEAMIDKLEDLTADRGDIRIDEIKEEAYGKIDEAEAELNAQEEDAYAQLEDAKAQIQDGREELNQARGEVSSGAQQITDAKAEISKKKTELEDAKAQYNSGIEQLEAGEQEYKDGLAQYEEGYAQYETAKTEFDGQVQQYEAGKQQLEEAKTGLTMLRAGKQQEYDAIKESQDPEDIEKAQILLQEIAGIDVQLETLAEQETILNEQGVEIEAGKAAFEETRLTLEASKQQLDEAAVEIEENKAQLEIARQQIADGESQLNTAEGQIEQSGKDLEYAKGEIAANESKLDEADAEYEASKKEAEDGFNDGRAEIEKSRQDVEELEAPEWYLMDRNDLPEFSGYKENADRMKAIGQVFPVLFFLVAALISLTSMTRMVEEQRTQIGTLKALGYDKFSIASKYLGYALLACVTGGIIGILVGEKVIPYIIIYAYGIMYHHIDEILIPYNAYYAIMAMGTAVLCTLAATFISCYKELASEPAVLMRPPAPKKGKRVFMERITVVWKHLSFIWKSTIRNLFRYKKRFFMTIFGIGGCMALILVGFGLKDSIFEIADVQYKEIQVYDGMVFVDDKDEEAIEALNTYMEDEKDIEDFINVRMNTVTLTNGKKDWEVTEVVPENEKKMEDFVKFRDRLSQEKYSLDDNGVILNEKSAKVLGVEVGDEFKIKDGHKEVPVKVSSICENYMGHFMYMTTELYEEIYGKEFKENSTYIKVKGDSKAALEKEGEKLISKDGVLGINYLHDIEKQLNEMLKSLNLVIMVLIVSAGMLAFVVLYNLNNINITERRRELATLKVLGFYDMEVGKYVYRENIVLTFLGSMAGVVLGIVLHRFIIQTVEIDTVMFGRVIDFSSYVISIAFTFGFSLFVNWVMYFKLKKINMVESLKSVE